MIHNACIAAFRTQQRKRHQVPNGAPPKSSTATPPGLTAMAEHQIHLCVQRQANDNAIPAFYTLCGYLVPQDNVEPACNRVTCPHCMHQAVKRHAG